MKKITVITVTVFACIISGYFLFSDGKSEQPYLVVLSMDGFRQDYCDIYNTPNLNRIRTTGVKAEYVQSSYPTVTFPNHYSMATGLYPDRHGLVNNTFYDSVLRDTFSLSKREAVSNPAYWSGEPIWITAETQNLNSAIFFWPGSEAPVKGMYADFWKKYDGRISYRQRIDTVIRWLQLPEKIRPHLIMFYFSEPDHSGHTHGPASDYTGTVVERLDRLAGILIDELDRLPVGRKINLIITSDHGMAAVSPEKTVFLSDYLPAHWIERQFTGAFTHLYTRPEYRDSVVQALQNVPNIRVFKKENLPSRLHYGTHPRTGDVVVIPDCGGWVSAGREFPVTMKGAHGYDNECDDMHAIFFARGPAFKQAYLQAPFVNVDLYNLMAAVLNLHPAANDGDFERVKGMLKMY
ncbi:MAG: ectonucleotide pyrophosphatase/phosphodiesterase [Prevotellaceae bacterium]|jgi:alkaline phosphatase D|nr:ectonucleotide pyrophosphatase/phosphodiesterase [Prevotellaceae bacterium]